MKEKLDIFSKIVICTLGAAIFGYFALKYLLVFALPFLIAWAMAFAVRPPAHFLAAKTGISERILRLFMSALLGVSGLSLVFFLAWKLITEIWRILNSLGADGEFFATVERVLHPHGILAKFLPEGIAELISTAFDSAVLRLTESFADFAARTVGLLPSLFLFFLVLVIACVYFALDLERVNSFVKSKLPPKLFSALVKLRNGIFGVGIKYAKAYLTLMFITFSVCLIGLCLLGVEYALVIALVISVLDLLPVIGVGTVFVPWAILEFAFGNKALGVGLLVLFLISEFIRQLAEPKIVGKNLGLHPIVSLILLYGSYSLFGFVGILLIPCAAVVINALLRKNDPPEVEKRSVRKRDKT